MKFEDLKNLYLNSKNISNLWILFVLQDITKHQILKFGMKEQKNIIFS